MRARDPKASMRGFGKHVRSLRRARGLTQEALGERSSLAADTIRRLEHDDFSPSLDTLNKLVGGLKMQLSTLFLGYEFDERAGHGEVLDLLVGRSPEEIEFGLKLLRAAYAQLDALRAAEKDAGD